MSHEFLAAHLNRPMFLLLRAVRHQGLRAASLIDGLVLRLNNKSGYPPLHLRRETGPLAGFEVLAGEFAGHVVTLGGLTRSSRVLDVGSGTGILALLLDARLGPDARYIGLEVERRLAGWAQRHLAHPNRAFVLYDYWNATYNPRGDRFAPFPVEDSWADVVVMKSVLTHMLPDDAAFYVRETARVLRPGGTALITAYLGDVDEPDTDAATAFPHRIDDHARATKKASPESGLCLDRIWLLNQCEQAGLDAAVFDGYWRRTSPSAVLNWQDVLVLRHRGSGSKVTDNVGSELSIADPV